MRAVLYETFGGPLALREVPDPTPAPHGAVLRVAATGLCRSDWHGWRGHDPAITLPHVPGHEIAGVVAAVGKDVQHWQGGERVTLPFVCGCGACPPCVSGNQQVCDNQSQPGFTHWGSFAEYVAVAHADLNLVPLPAALDFVTAASLGCRFATSFRAVVDQGRVRAGQWVAVHGCGGVGLSAVMIAHALGARVVAVDIAEDKLALARAVGAAATVNAREEADVVGRVKDITAGGAHVSLDALGSPATCFNAVAGLRKRGRHVQVGLLLAEHRHTALPMDRIVADELEVVGSHGIQAHRYEELFALIESGALQPGRLVGRTISLEEACEALPALDHFPGAGLTVIDTFA